MAVGNRNTGRADLVGIDDGATDSVFLVASGFANGCVERCGTTGFVSVFFFSEMIFFSVTMIGVNFVVGSSVVVGFFS